MTDKPKATVDVLKVTPLLHKLPWHVHTCCVDLPAVL